MTETAAVKRFSPRRMTLLLSKFWRDIKGHNIGRRETMTTKALKMTISTL